MRLWEEELLRGRKRSANAPFEKGSLQPKVHYPLS